MSTIIFLPIPCRSSEAASKQAELDVEDGLVPVLSSNPRSIRSTLGQHSCEKLSDPAYDMGTGEDRTSRSKPRQRHHHAGRLHWMTARSWSREIAAPRQCC